MFRAAAVALCVIAGAACRVMIGVSFEVIYHVKVPVTATVLARTASGAITITGRTSRLVVSTVNGAITGNSVAGLAFQAFDNQNRRRVRGRINAGGTPIELATVNGDIQVHERR